MKNLREYQTKLESLEESIFNVVVGYTVSVLAAYIVLPWFGFTTITGLQSMGIGLVFTVISIARSYILRRFYEWGGLRKIWKQTNTKEM